MNRAISKWAVLLWSAFFVLVHQPDGQPVYLNAEQIDLIAPADKTYHGKNAGSRVMVYGLWVAIREKPDEIKCAIDTVLKQEFTSCSAN
jgi:hypothetical protein